MITPNEGEKIADMLQEIKEICQSEEEYAIAYYCAEMAQLEVSRILAKRDNEHCKSIAKTAH